MSRVTRRLFDDGISRIERVALVPGRGSRPAEIRRALHEMFGRGWGYEYAIAAAERYWRTVPADPAAPPLSRAWYARTILTDLAWLRRVLADARQTGLAAPHVEAVVVAALTLGSTLKDAEWRFTLGDEVRLGRRSRENLRGASRAAAEQRADAAAERRARILEAVAAYRREHPDHSDRTIARNLARRLVESESTIRRALRPQKTA